MRTLYPPLDPYRIHHIRADDIHQIYVEESGNPSGIPVVFLHGGPGSGCSDIHRRYFDPDYFRIILFDQRGSGKSLPLGETSLNDTEHLVSDMEIIRRHLSIDKWMIFAGSWGATLALVYTIAHLKKVTALILRGVFLARESDLKWFFIELERIFPKAWEQLTRDVGSGDKIRQLIDWYYNRVRQNDIEAARSWSAWGSMVVNWHRSQDEVLPAKNGESDLKSASLLAKVKIETHYAYHCYFLGDKQILEAVASLAKIPVSILHGRFDLTCTMQAAWQLHKAIPGSTFIKVAEAGHLIDEPAMISALVEETDRIRGLLTRV